MTENVATTTLQKNSYRIVPYLTHFNQKFTVIISIIFLHTLQGFAHVSKVHNEKIQTKNYTLYSLIKLEK